MHLTVKVMAGLSALSAVTAAAATSEGTPALSTHIWTGQVNTETQTLYGDSVEDIVNQIYNADPTANKTALMAEVSTTGLTLVALDKGWPVDLPDIGVPDMPWKGVGGPFTDYNNSIITYPYSCGDFATADEATVRKGAYALRNKPGENAFTPGGRCARQWCKDTTAMFLCSTEGEDVTVPQYNVGWMTDRLHRLCCDDNSGKSGQMWHYTNKYSVVMGYANCREEAATNQPYAYGLGNNGFCRAEAPGLW